MWVKSTQLDGTLADYDGNSDAISKMLFKTFPFSQHFQ